MKIKDYTYKHPWLKRIKRFIITYVTILAAIWLFLDPLDPLGLSLLKGFKILGYIGLLMISLLLTLVVLAFFTEKTRRTLPKIETALRKDKDIEPEFSRKAGPSWVDFERKYIVRRDEVNEIINKLNEEPQQVIEGRPASGKSVLLKNIGFNLANSGYEVFYVDCKNKQEKNIETYLEEALEIDDAKTLIIIDDYHLKIDVCEDFLEQYQNQGINKTKVLIGTRPIDEKGPKRHLKIHDLNKKYLFSIEEEFEDDLNNGIVSEKLKDMFKTKGFLLSENAMVTKEKDDKWVITDGEKIYIVKKEDGKLNIYNKNKTQITSGSVSQNIIYKYLKEQKQFDLSDEKIKDLSMSFSEYERDLWYLSWALKVFNPEEGVIKIHIYENIKNSILEIKDSAEDIFLPLSILNRFEIPMEKRILTNREYGLGIEKKEIDNLIEQNEIVQTKVTDSKERTALALHHSSLAELNYETYRNTELGEDFKDRFEIYGDGDFEEGFLLYYLLHSDLLYYIDTTSLDFQDFFVGIIEQNRSNNDLKKKIREAIQYNIDSDKDLEKHELYLYGYLHSWLPTGFVTEWVHELDFATLAGRLNETDDIGRISSFLGTTQGPFLKKLMGQIDLENLKSKVINDIWALSGVLGALANTDNAITRHVLDMAGIPHIKELFSKFEFSSVEEMGRCYGIIAAADDKLAYELSMIVKTRLKEMSKPIVDDIPDKSPLQEAMPLIQGAAEMQSLYGSHYGVLDTLFAALEDIIKEKIQETIYYFVDMSGGDLSEAEAREEVLEGIKNEFWFGCWNEDAFKRTLARFDIT